MDLMPKTLLLIMCLVGFFVIVFDQVKNWMEGKKGTAISMETKKTFTFPPIAFCPKSPIKNKNSRYNPYLTREEYLNTFTELDVNFTGIGLHEGNKFEYKNYEIRDVFTLYSGLCKVFQINGEFKVKMRASFILPQDQDADIIIFEHFTDEILLITLAYGSDFQTLEWKSNMMVELYRKEYILLQGCSENAKSKGQYAIEFIEKEFKENSFSCLPGHYAQYLPQLNLPECTDPDVLREIFNVTRETTAKVNSGDLEISRSCHRMLYESDKIPFFYDLESENGIEEEMLLITVASDKIQKSEEYLIYNTVSIVSAIGGGLGMFLGWSVYQNFQLVCDFLSRKNFFDFKK